jgi:hypothetical protein
MGTNNDVCVLILRVLPLNSLSAIPLLSPSDRIRQYLMIKAVELEICPTVVNCSAGLMASYVH